MLNDLGVADLVLSRITSTGSTHWVSDKHKDINATTWSMCSLGNISFPEIHFFMFDSKKYTLNVRVKYRPITRRSNCVKNNDPCLLAAQIFASWNNFSSVALKGAESKNLVMLYLVITLTTSKGIKESRMNSRYSFLVSSPCKSQDFPFSVLYMVRKPKNGSKMLSFARAWQLRWGACWTTLFPSNSGRQGHKVDPTIFYIWRDCPGGTPSPK